MICAKCGKPRERENHSYCRHCAAEYMRLWHRGAIPARPTICTIVGCTRPIHGNGLCNLHRSRLARTGMTDAPIRKSLASKRYKLVKRPGHPLAHATTHRVYEHRAVLFDQVGMGWVPCFWCGNPVKFSTEHPQPPDALITDHLDHDRHNNAPTNVMPACNSCNCARSHWRTLPPLESIYSSGMI
jgi:hypothetical protein